MNRSQILLTLAIIIAFPIFFGGLWSGICYLIGAVGGWQTLASKYETAKDTIIDQKFTSEYGQFGVSRYKFTLTVGFSKTGIYFANNPFFRIGHPPLLIPWSAIKVVSNDGLYLHIQADEMHIWLNKKFFATIQSYLLKP